MTAEDNKNKAEAIALITNGLSFRMDQLAREWAEDALWLLKNGRHENGIDALCEATALCDDPVASHHLREARMLLAPDRISSS